MIFLKPVQSSTISAIGHDGTHLWVLFSSNQLYQYLNCPNGLYIELMASSSKGSFLNSDIKPLFSAVKSTEPYKIQVKPSLSLRDLITGPSFGF